MEIIRFDEEFAIPIDAHGSRFRLGPLVGDDSKGRVQLAYLPAGGLIGRHAAHGRQLFGVVAGHGWVSGADGVRRDVGPGFGAIWEDGESHEAGSESGLTAVVVEGEFDCWSYTVTRDIVVSDYDPAWPADFERIRAYVWPAVKDLALRVDHVGSTSVPDLPAKPIIDLDVVVASPSDVRAAVKALRGIGYRWIGDLNVVGREAFSWDAPVGAPTLPPHHLYVVVLENKAHLDHVLLRDLMREDGDARRRYGELKRQNAVLADRNMDVYVDAKADFVNEMLARARAERGLAP